uniref:Uncharacterized protein n=1 Tax=Janibacter limosus TaxID=53458 RepID=A0AC61U3I2_9MICO|nr:hypothetical protein [Janibacter limosus]
MTPGASGQPRLFWMRQEGTTQWYGPQQMCLPGYPPAPDVNDPTIPRTPPPPPVPTIAQIRSAFLELPFAKPSVSMQPVGNKTLVGLPTYYQADWPDTDDLQPGDISDSVKLLSLDHPVQDPGQGLPLHLRRRHQLRVDDEPRRRPPGRGHHPHVQGHRHPLGQGRRTTRRPVPRQRRRSAGPRRSRRPPGRTRHPAAGRRHPYPPRRQLSARSLRDGRGRPPQGPGMEGWRSIKPKSPGAA